MDELSRNEAFEFLARRKFPGYWQLKRTRSERHRSGGLSFTDVDLSNRLAAYICKLRHLEDSEIADLLREEREKAQSESEASRLERLETLKQEDEKNFFNRPDQKADLQFWAGFDFWTIDEAVALTFGRNPEVVNWKVVLPYSSGWPFPEEYARRRKLVKRACKLGALTNPIKPAAFLKWARTKQFGFPDELEALLTVFGSSKYTSNPMEVRETIESGECKELDNDNSSSPELAGTESDSPSLQELKEKAFDSVPITVIAMMFRISSKLDDDIEVWETRARCASRNGLDGCRTQKGIGQGKSLFNPVKVANWLVNNKGGSDQAKVDRILCKNLPDRSKHLIDELFPGMNLLQ